jgi:hypothetical protein
MVAALTLVGVAPSAISMAADATAPSIEDECACGGGSIVRYLWPTSPTGYRCYSNQAYFVC